MTLNELKFIVALAKSRNFRKAAEVCFVSQPALSLAVKKLEDELGVLLFERSRNDVTMTPVGELIIEQATRVIEEAKRVKEIAKQGNNQLAGPLKLGVIYSVGPYLLPEIIPILRKNAPEMPLIVEENLTSNLEMHLRNGVIDVAIIALPFELSGVTTMPLYEEEFVVVVPITHEWANRNEVDVSELADEKVLLLNSGHCFSNQVVQACPSLTRNGEILQGNSLDTVRNMVASNLGITVLPMSATISRYQNALVKAIPFRQPVPTRKIALAWRKSYGRVQAVEAIANAIRTLEMSQAGLL
ncbi:LysR substrate-binding domain-containing protein [Candidatus Methylopumilus turicensis]|uniref:Hydrogen peroxide-inducible genes activator n=1 Tax=Candidatus Methylopumilus turicensis TaxID=1581680 RepID=A0A0B7IS17_9PROT|nr:LysR substrate-binding domain-containing protein [Candidatus Methylopumilus turicensis]CEN55068.1 Hydrogen peroxide-inducible genes activator [Candidatus Methylopumilus turicensis]